MPCSLYGQEASHSRIPYGSWKPFFDFNVPEEINRMIIDHIADFNLVYTEHARRHLISEALPQRRIYLTVVLWGGY